MKFSKNLDSNNLNIHTGHTNFILSLRELFIFESKDWILSIPSLEWKNIADIWTGFSDYMNYLREILWNKSKIICIDKVYEKWYIKWWLQRTIKNTKEIIDNLSNKKNWLVIDDYFLHEKKSELVSLHNWEKNNWIIYKTKLEESDNIDIVFCKNLFCSIKSPIEFITEILKNLNYNWELIIIDYPLLDNYNIIFLNILSKLSIDKLSPINGIICNISKDTKNEYILFKIDKKFFLEHIEDIKYIEKNLNSYVTFL